MSISICKKHKVDFSGNMTGECPLCVRDDRDKAEAEVERLRESSLVEIGRADTAEREVEMLRNEIERLRSVIIYEGKMWECHHTDPMKQHYWQEFQAKAVRGEA